MPALDASAGSSLGSLLRTDPCALLFRLAASHPGETLRLDLGGTYVTIFQDAMSAAHILREHPGTYNKNFGSFSAYFGHSRLTADGDLWRVLHSLSQPLLNGLGPDRLAARTLGFFGEASRRLRENSAAPVEIDREIDLAAAAVSLDLIFGADPAVFGDAELTDLRTVLAYCASLTWNLDPSTPRPDMGDRTRADAAMARLRHLFEALLANHGHADGLISSVRDTELGIDRIGELSSMFFASMDTSSAALGWAMWMLATQPALQEELRRETEAAFAAGNAADVPLLNAFLNETLRMFPPVPLLSRIASHTDRIGDIPVEPGDRIIVSVIGVHHDRLVWPDAQKFDPSRFPDGKIPAALRPHFLPFSSGQRVCGGMRVALVELPNALAALLHGVEISVSDKTPLAFSWGASLRRRGGHSLRMTSRAHPAG